MSNWFNKGLERATDEVSSFMIVVVLAIGLVLGTMLAKVYFENSAFVCDISKGIGCCFSVVSIWILFVIFSVCIGGLILFWIFDSMFPESNILNLIENIDNAFEKQDSKITTIKYNCDDTELEVVRNKIRISELENQIEELKSELYRKKKPKNKVVKKDKKTDIDKECNRILKLLQNKKRTITRLRNITKNYGHRIRKLRAQGNKIIREGNYYRLIV